MRAAGAGRQAAGSGLDPGTVAAARKQDDDAAGCAACVGFFLALAFAIAAVISLAALVDPFAWMPAVAEVWADCEDEWSTSTDECALATRFPGFWVHVVVNLAWAALAVLAALAAFASAHDAREARQARFDGPAALARWREAREALAAVVAAGLVLAAVPVVVGLL